MSLFLLIIVVFWIFYILLKIAFLNSRDVLLNVCDYNMEIGTKISVIYRSGGMFMKILLRFV